MKRKFEIPYNFDKGLIDGLLPHKDSIEFIYAAPYKGHMSDARSTDPMAASRYPSSLEDYKSHIKTISEKGFRTAILFQSPETKFDYELTNFYVGLGATDFVVTNDDLASSIKNAFPGIRLHASLTKSLKFDDFVLNAEFYANTYFSMVLPFEFSRALSILELLPRPMNYSILVNTDCACFCDFRNTHWFKIAPAGSQCPTSAKTSCRVLPDALHLFDNLVYAFKLQGREYDSDRILCEVNEYVNAPFSTPETVSTPTTWTGVHFNSVEELRPHYEYSSKRIKEESKCLTP